MITISYDCRYFGAAIPMVRVPTGYTHFAALPVRSPLPMPLRFRNLLAAILLPLLIGTFSAEPASGGWYCADGLQCEPAAAYSCCCVVSSPCADDQCREEGGEHHAAVTAGPCGCYYHAGPLDSDLQKQPAVWFVAAAPPPAFDSFRTPPVRLITINSTEDAPKPPQWPSYWRVDRGPPAA